MPPLLGHAVGITGDRRSAELAAHLEAMGASVLMGPVLHTKPLNDDDRELRFATAAVIERPPAYLLATTGIGMRSWVNAAAAWGLQPPLLAALRRARILARGPKVVGALVEAGLDVWFAAPTGQTSTMVDHLLERSIAGDHVVVQDPGEPMPDVVGRLVTAGATVTSVGIYDWAWPDDLTRPRRLVRAIAERRLSAVTFTSRPAVRNLVALAASDDLEEAVCRALLEDVVPVCIGAVTGETLRQLTGAVPRLPVRALLGMLAPTVAEEVRLAGHQHVRTERGEVVVQRRLVDGRGARVLMSDREADLLKHLVTNAHRTVGREELVRSVWGSTDVDPSVLETTVARLRRRLQVTGLSVRTVTGRGYLLAGELVDCGMTSAAV